jgi:hypothetical protein
MPIWPDDAENLPYYRGLHRDGQGYIYWKGKQVEHYSYPSTPDGERREREELRMLWNRCYYLESIGVPVGTPALAHWSWFADVDQKTMDWAMPLLRMLPGFWVRPTLNTPLANIPGGQHRIEDEGDELLVSATTGKYVIWNRATMLATAYTPPPPDESEVGIWYYTLEREGWRTPNADGINRPAGNGIVCATGWGILNLLTRFRVPIWIRHLL